MVLIVGSVAVQQLFAGERETGEDQASLHSIVRNVKIRVVGNHFLGGEKYIDVAD